MPAEHGSVARQAASGKVLWRSPCAGPVDCGAAIDEKFIGMGSGQIVGLEGKTGKTLWSLPYPKDDSHYGSFVSGYLFAHSKMIDPDGNVLITFDRDTDIGQPCWTDGTNLVSLDHNRLFRFRTGQMPPLPQGVKARKTEVEGLLAHIGELDSQERKRLVQLGDDAFGPVLQAFEQACKTDDEDSDHLFSILDRLCRPEHCPALIRALKEMPTTNSDMRRLYSALIRVGNASEVTQFFLYELDKTKNVETPLAWEYIAEDYIINSSHPDAIEFMLNQLGDPTAAYGAAAYFNLARTGGERGLRKQRALLRSLPDRVLSATETKALDERTDSDGRTYGLLQCDVLGDARDLWLAEKVGSRWNLPTFTGLQDQPGADWFAKLVGNSEISKDSDGDGLTDLEEQRLGTNPSLPDTDGDGDPDDLDPWPNVSKRHNLTDDEQILATAFEARFHFSKREVAGVLVAPNELRPFEMPGFDGPMLWRASSDPPLPLESRSQGTAKIDFESEDTLESGDPPKELISWNPQHTEATVVIGASYGGEEGAGYKVVLRKFGDTWVAILRQRVWIF